MIGKRKIIIIGSIALIALVCWNVIFGSPSFDSDAIAEAETLMWKAYYSGDKMELGFQLIGMLRNQWGMSLMEAKEVGELLANASMKFSKARGNYEKLVLGDLNQVYSKIRDFSGRDFDPEEAARAELAWWVARRTPGEDAPEQVGDKIAALYRVLYGGDHPSFTRAGLLRAQAASLRDGGADRETIETLLKQSYAELAKAI